MPEIYQSPEIITTYPFDEGLKAHELGKSVHDNPYKSPNTPRTCDVKSEAWLRGFETNSKNQKI